MSNMLPITDYTLPPAGRVSGDGAFWCQRGFGGGGGGGRCEGGKSVAVR